MPTPDDRLSGLVERPSVILTVADHEQNGFVHLVRWPFASMAEARAFVRSVDGEVTDESEPDIRSAAFTFILDLCDGWDTVDNGKRLLPTQVAMSIAPEAVRDWLDERPDPDSVSGRRIPAGPDSALKSRSPQP